jgi:Growth regulator
MTTTIVKWGNSRGVRLPKPFLESLDLKDNDIVDIIAEDGKIIIQKSHQSKTLKQRVEEFYGKDFDAVVKENPYEFEEIDWGSPVGEEIW